MVKTLLRNLFQLEWWNFAVSFKFSGWFFAITIPLVSILAIPTQVTVDSIFYIASAKSLFTPDFGSFYVWYREPGYPIFLWLIHLAGNNALYVQAVQAMFMGLSVWMLLYAFRRSAGHNNITRLQLGIAVLFIFNPMFFSYSGNFLQQAMFCFILASFAVLVDWSRKLPPRLNELKLVTLALVLYLMGILTSVGWLYFSLFPILLIYINIFRRRKDIFFRNSNHLAGFKRFLLGSLVVISLTAISFGIGRATYASWETFKKPYAEQVDYKTTVISPDSIPSFGNPVDIATRFLALMDLTHIEPYEPQNEIFEEAAMRLRFLHSEWDTAYVNPPTTDYAPGYFVLSDPSLIAHSIFSILAPTSPFAYKLTYGLFGIITLLLLIRKRWPELALTFIPMSFIFIHAANNTPVDRYGIPGYPFAIALVVLAISHLVVKFSPQRDI